MRDPILPHISVFVFLFQSKALRGEQRWSPITGLGLVPMSWYHEWRKESGRVELVRGKRELKKSRKFFGANLLSGVSWSLLLLTWRGRWEEGVGYYGSYMGVIVIYIMCRGVFKYLGCNLSSGSVMCLVAEPLFSGKTEWPDHLLVHFRYIC